jgi:hypothetical protein
MDWRLWRAASSGDSDQLLTAFFSVVATLLDINTPAPS